MSIQPPPHVAAVCALLGCKSSAAPACAEHLLDVDWDAAIAFADEELVTPELYPAIADASRDDSVPEEVRDYVAHLHDLNQARNRRILEQLIEITRAWNRAGIFPMVLKSGADLLTRGGAATPVSGCGGMMTDLDVLLKSSEIDNAVKVAETLGYQQPADLDPGSHAYVYLFRRGEPAPFDLHRELVKPSHLLPTGSVYDRATPVDIDGAVALVPAAEDQLIHRVLHDMVQGGAHRGGILELRSLTNFARIVTANPTLDWAAVVERLKPLGAHHVLRAQAFAARCLLGVSVPSVACGGVAAHLYLRRGLARWRPLPANRLSEYLSLVLQGMAYPFDPAARIVPLPKKVIRRILFGNEPTPWERAQVS